MRETFESALILSQRALQGMGIDEEKARTVVTEIRKRDRNRLKEQVKGDVYSGQQHILNKPIKPEPLKWRLNNVTYKALKHLLHLL